MTQHPFAQMIVAPGSIGIHWFEQNAYALKGPSGKIMLIDPFFPHHRPPEWYIRSTPPVVESELPTDYVLVTHAHMDHTNSETITCVHQGSPEVVVVGPEESTEQVIRETEVDAEHTQTIAAGSILALDGFTVFAVYGKPVEGDPDAGIRAPDVTHLSYVVDVEGIRVYISGDIINNLAEHDELLQPIAALRPDIGFLTTHPTEGEFPFFDGSVKIATKLGLRTAVPSHYACFAKRTYNPQEWAALFPADGPRPLIIPWNSSVLYQLP